MDPKDTSYTVEYDGQYSFEASDQQSSSSMSVLKFSNPESGTRKRRSRSVKSDASNPHKRIHSFEGPPPLRYGPRKSAPAAPAVSGATLAPSYGPGFAPLHPAHPPAHFNTAPPSPSAPVGWGTFHELTEHLSWDPSTPSITPLSFSPTLSPAPQQSAPAAPVMSSALSYGPGYAHLRQTPQPLHFSTAPPSPSAPAAWGMFPDLPGHQSCGPSTPLGTSPPFSPAPMERTATDALSRSLSLFPLRSAPNSVPQTPYPPRTPVELSTNSFSYDNDDSFNNEYNVLPASLSSSRPRKRAPKAKTGNIKEALALLRKADVTPLEMLLMILEGGNDEFSHYRNAFFQDRNHERIRTLLDTIRSHKSTKAMFVDWLTEPAVELVSRKVFDEMEAAKPLLHMEMKDISSEYIDTWSIESIMGQISREVTPTWSHILRVATSPRYPTNGVAEDELDDSEGPEEGSEDNEGRNRPLARQIIASQVHYLRSHFSCKVQIGIGIIAWAMGASRQLIGIMHQSGLTRCFTSNLNAVEMMGERGIEQARKIAEGPHCLSYDNINISTSNFVEQTANTKAKVQSGTFPVIYKLPPWVEKKSMLLKPVLEARQNAPDLQMKDLRPTPESLAAYRHQTAVNIVQILLDFTTEFPDTYTKDKKLQHLVRRCLPEGYRTEYFPLGVAPIDESSTHGNLLVHDQVYLQQLQKHVNELVEYIIVTINDQLTNSRVRSCQGMRKGDDGPWHSRQVFELAPALFHLVLNLVWILKEVHYGTIHEVGSLAQLFTVLDKTRLAGAKPDFHTLHAALMQILAGIVLNAWEAECGHDDLASFAQSKPSPERLLEIANRIIQNHATPATATSPAFKEPKGSHSAPTAAASPETNDRDIVRENIKRLTRDLLLVTELVSAIKDGDFGRVEDVLPDLVFIFRGAGSNNYAMEILHLIHNFKYVWSEDLANAIRDMAIINISGLPGHAMGIDLNIEHLIRYLKSLFTAKGIYSNWDRCTHISAAINNILILKRRITRSLKISYQGSTHTKADSGILVKRMQAKAKELELHLTIPGRQNAGERPDLRAVGAQKIQSGTLSTFNAKWRAIVSGACTQSVEEVDEIPAPDFGGTPGDSITDALSVL